MERREVAALPVGSSLVRDDGPVERVHQAAIARGSELVRNWLSELEGKDESEFDLAAFKTQLKDIEEQLNAIEPAEGGTGAEADGDDSATRPQDCVLS